MLECAFVKNSYCTLIIALLSRGTYITFASTMRIRQPTLDLKLRGDVTRNPKQGYQWPQKKDMCPPKTLKKKTNSYCTLLSNHFILLDILGHADVSTNEIYVQLETEDGHCLLLSPGHLLHVGYHGNLKTAREASIGDTVLVMVQSSLKPGTVTAKTQAMKRGAFCPHTIGIY